jgi:hypothetical protein
MAFSSNKWQDADMHHQAIVAALEPPTVKKQKRKGRSCILL